MTPKPEPRPCDCGCGAIFTPPPTAPHKRFASTHCRDSFHSKRRLDALRELEKREGQGRAQTAEIELTKEKEH